MVHFFLVIFSDTILMLGLFNVGMKVLAWYLDLYCIEKTFKYLIAIGFFFFFGAKTSFYIPKWYQK